MFVQKQNRTDMDRRPLTVVTLIVLLALLLVGCGQSIARQETTPSWTAPVLPDTPAGRKLDAYVKVFNGGDQEALKQFVADNFTPEGPGGADIKQRTGSQLQLYKASQGLNLYQVEDASDTSVSVLAQLRLTEEWRRLTFGVEDTPPYLITGIRIEPIDPPVIASSGQQHEEPLGQQIDAYVRNLVAADRFSGVVLVAKDGTLLFEQAYGTANQEAGHPNHMTTRFDLASASKMFTAVAIAQLAEQGRLTYDDPISTHLPEYPTETIGPVTIDQLLTHRSGIVDYFAEMERFAIVKHSRDPQHDYPALFRDEPLRFTPGERFEYSNSNYILLGAIIERVSGQRYDDYIRTHIFEPAGMKETRISSEGIDVTLLAHKYTHMGTDGAMTLEDRRLADAETPTVGSAAGGAYSTAGDLLKFAQALRTHRLLGEEATRQMLIDRVDYERPGYRYAYGFIVRQTGQERIVGHSGGFPGVDAQFDMYLDRGYTVIVLANYEFVAEPVVMRIQQMLTPSP